MIPPDYGMNYFTCKRGIPERTPGLSERKIAESLIKGESGTQSRLLVSERSFPTSSFIKTNSINLLGRATEVRWAVLIRVYSAYAAKLHLLQQRIR
jgi:hypothetical protein